jgi:hypothetical protein
VEKGSAKLGLLRTFIGDVPCAEEDMLDAMASEHTQSVYADVAFVSSTAHATTPSKEWVRAMQDHTPVALDTENYHQPLSQEDFHAMLDLLIASPEANGGNLMRSEAMALLLLLGPMREVYNWRLAAPVASSHTAVNHAPLVHSTLGLQSKGAIVLKHEGAVADLAREFLTIRPSEFQPRAFTNGFEVTLHCACSALLKLGRMKTGRARVPLYKGLPGASVRPDALHHESSTASHELGFMLCTAHLLRVLAEFQEDWKGIMSQWERELQDQDVKHNVVNTNWTQALKTGKIMNTVFEIQDGEHVGVDLTWVAKACGRLSEDAPEMEVVVFPPFCSLRAMKEADVRIHNPYTYRGAGIFGRGLYEYCCIPLDVLGHPGMRTLEEEGPLGTRRKAAHSVLINEFLVELSKTMKWKDEWEGSELDRMAAALHHPPRYYRNEANLAKAFKDVVDLRNAIHMKRTTAQRLEDNVEDRSKFAVTPKMRETPQLLTIVSGFELPDPLMQPEKDRLHWLATLVRKAPAQFFLSKTCYHKIENDFWAVPWAYLEHSAMPDVDPNGCQLPHGACATYETLNFAWTFVVESGIRHVRVRPPRDLSESCDVNAGALIVDCPVSWSYKVTSMHRCAYCWSYILKCARVRVRILVRVRVRC